MFFPKPSDISIVSVITSRNIYIFFFLFIINYRGPTSGYGGQVFLVFGEDGPSKWGLDLIDQWQKGMTLEVFAKMAMASFVLVIPYTPLPFPCAGCALEYSCKY